MTRSKAFDGALLAFIVGLMSGFGCAGFVWMNGYIASSLALVGFLLFAVVLVALGEDRK
jgi:uncharacterized membrane protein